MTKANQDVVEFLKELDEKRIPGDIKINEFFDQDGVLLYVGDYKAAYDNWDKNISKYSEDYNHQGKSVLAFFQGDYDSEAGCSYDETTLKFLSQAPTMMSVIKNLQAQLTAALKECERLREALEPLAEYANIAETICSDRGYYSGDRLSLTEIPEACPTLGMLRKCRATLQPKPQGEK